MQPEIIQRLLDINHQFYQNFAGSFSETRRRIQPGVRRVLDRLPMDGNLVDLGCGNGELAVQLSRRGQRGAYLGLDFSLGLLDEAGRAARRQENEGLTVRFQAFNLAEPDNLPEAAKGMQPITTVFSFATLHHLPSAQLRLKLLGQVGQLLRDSQIPDRLFIHSEWQFLNSPRLVERILPWELVGLSKDQVEAGDYLLDWRRGGTALRYVHAFTPDELAGMAEQAGFEILETFLSDGEGGNLGLYQVWRPQENRVIS